MYVPTFNINAYVAILLKLLLTFVSHVPPRTFPSKVYSTYKTTNLLLILVSHNK